MNEIVSSSEGLDTNCFKDWEHYAKWNKPGGERQIPYDFIFKWYLINKINKQAKYNQRHWN